MNKRNDARGRKSNRKHRQTRVEDLLSQLVSYQDQTRTRMEPDIMDVPRLKLSPKRSFTTAFNYTAAPITGNSLTPTGGALIFMLSNAGDYQSWVNVFDSYKVIQVHVEFTSASVGVTGTTNTNGQIYTVIDYDDANVLLPGDLVQYDTCQVVSSPQFFERRLVPRTAKALYSGTFTSYGQDTMPWIDTSSPSVQHYGIKYSQTPTSSAVTTYTPIVTMFVKFRNSH